MSHGQRRCVPMKTLLVIEVNRSKRFTFLDLFEQQTPKEEALRVVRGFTQFA